MGAMHVMNDISIIIAKKTSPLLVTVVAVDLLDLQATEREAEHARKIQIARVAAGTIVAQHATAACAPHARVLHSICATSATHPTHTCTPTASWGAQQTCVQGAVMAPAPTGMSASSRQSDGPCITTAALLQVAHLYMVRWESCRKRGGGGAGQQQEGLHASPETDRPRVSAHRAR